MAAVTQAAPVRQKRVSQSYLSLVWWKFKKNKLAVFGGILVILFYVVCGLFAEFFAPYLLQNQTRYLEAQPQTLVFKDANGNFSLRPAVYGLEQKVDTVLRRRTFEPTPEIIYPLYFFVKGQPYKLLGFIPTDIHFFGTHPDNPDAVAFLMGTDRLGRDNLSRIIYGGRLSLLLGLIGQILTLALGLVMGVISGY